MDRHLVVTPLAPGTRVVLLRDLPAEDGWICKKGMLARVVEASPPHYRLSTPAGRTLRAERGEVVVQNTSVEDQLVRRDLDWERLRPHVVLETVVGSRAWNLANEDSDTDVRGAFLLPFDAHARLLAPPDELAPPGDQAQYWEVEKLIRQGLRADANTLEMLWSPLVRVETPIGRLLRERRDIFTSRRVHGSFGRYALSQLEKMLLKLDQHDTETALRAALITEPDLDDQALLARLAGRGIDAERVRRVAHAWYDRGATTARSLQALRQAIADGAPPTEPWRPKNAYNLLRLLHSGLRWLRHGEPLIGIPDGAIRDRLLAIKAVKVPLEEVVTEARGLIAELDEAATTTTLPEHPDVAAADELLHACRAWAARMAFQLPTQPVVVVPREPARERRVELPEAEIRACLDSLQVDLVVCSVTGSHDGGFAAEGSDVDLKAIHLEPAWQTLARGPVEQALNHTRSVGGVVLDVTSNEAAAAVRLLVRGDGNMLERIASPYVMAPGAGASDAARRRLGELRALALAGVHQGAWHHYRGFLAQVVRVARAEGTPKRWLHVYRVGLTGVHLLRTGEVLASLPDLVDQWGFPHARELIGARQAGGDRAADDAMLARAAADAERVEVLLEQARPQSDLPLTCPNEGDLWDWLAWWRTVPV